MPFEKKSGYGKAVVAFQGFVNDLLGLGQKGETQETPMSLAALKFKYHSQWPDYVDLLRPEDREQADREQGKVE